MIGQDDLAYLFGLIGFGHAVQRLQVQNLDHPRAAENGLRRGEVATDQLTPFNDAD